MGCDGEGDKTRKSLYIGETNRTPYERGLEHWEGLKKKDPADPLWKHTMGSHNGTHQDYEMSVISSHRTPLERQVTEWVLITLEGKKNTLINSKDE